MPLQSNFLYIGFDSLSNDPQHHFVIYYKHFPLFHGWKLKSLIIELNGKLVINRSDLAIKCGYNPSKIHFESVKELIDFLEIEFCKVFCEKHKIQIPHYKI